LLLCAIAWALSHGYRGLFHDAGLYTLQALARLTPTSLGQTCFFVSARVPGADAWQIDDWARAAVTLPTLSVRLVSVTAERARTLCQAALLTTGGGLVLTFIACDELHLVLLTQLQP
jgi:hypothetical protein